MKCGLFYFEEHVVSIKVQFIEIVIELFFVMTVYVKCGRAFIVINLEVIAILTIL